jgi:hypothetical protein
VSDSDGGKAIAERTVNSTLQINVEGTLRAAMNRQKSNPTVSSHGKEWYDSLDSHAQLQIQKGIEALLFAGCMTAASRLFDTVVREEMTRIYVPSDPTAATPLDPLELTETDSGGSGGDQTLSLTDPSEPSSLIEFDGSNGSDDFDNGPGDGVNDETQLSSNDSPESDSDSMDGVFNDLSSTSEEYHAENMRLYEKYEEQITPTFRTFIKSVPPTSDYWIHREIRKCFLQKSLDEKVVDIHKYYALKLCYRIGRLDDALRRYVISRDMQLIGTEEDRLANGEFKIRPRKQVNKGSLAASVGDSGGYPLFCYPIDRDHENDSCTTRETRLILPMHAVLRFVHLDAMKSLGLLHHKDPGFTWLQEMKNGQTVTDVVSHLNHEPSEHNFWLFGTCGYQLNDERGNACTTCKCNHHPLFKCLKQCSDKTCRQCYFHRGESEMTRQHSLLEKFKKFLGPGAGNQNMFVAFILYKFPDLQVTETEHSGGKIIRFLDPADQKLDFEPKEGMIVRAMYRGTGQNLTTDRIKYAKIISITHSGGHMALFVHWEGNIKVSNRYPVEIGRVVDYWRVGAKSGEISQSPSRTKLPASIVKLWPIEICVRIIVDEKVEYERSIPEWS